MTLHASIEQEIQKLALDAEIELFEIDLTPWGDEIYRFHAGVNKISQPITWQENVYPAYPIMITGYDKTTGAQLPRPRMVLSNVAGTVTALILAHGEMLGAIVTKKKTYAKYLDAVNFPGGINPDADPTVSFPDEIYGINRRVRHNKKSVEYELAAPHDLIGRTIPGRQITHMCPFKYRGTECGYAGSNYFNADDTPADNLQNDRCGKRLSSCKLRFGATNPLSFGGFPGGGRSS